MNSNKFMEIGFDESESAQSLVDDVDMCEDCGDAVATTLRGYGLGQRMVCSDCNCEMGW